MPTSIVLAACAAVFLEGCGAMLLLDPKGPIGHEERFLILTAFGLMLIVVVPVFVLAYLFSKKYRASQPTGEYRPKWSYSVPLDIVVWGIPIAIVICLGYLTWTKTHQLDPYKPLDTVKPINIQAVSMDWKWLFIYPDHDLAVINQLVFPAKTPLSFKITSDTVMTSFFIPQLGSQMYAMAGMQTRLHLMADEPGSYIGHNQQFSGVGYSDMDFTATATTPEQFQAWVQKAKRQSSEKLDMARYAQLSQPGLGQPVTFFSPVSAGLFENIIRKFKPEWGKDSADMMEHPGRAGERP